MLSPLVRDTMRGWLEGVFDPMRHGRVTSDLLIATLKALAHVGEAGDIPLVAALANMETRHSDQVKIKRAAAQCLRILRTNFGSAESAQTLSPAAQPEPFDAAKSASSAPVPDPFASLRGNGKTETPAPPVPVPPAPPASAERWQAVPYIARDNRLRVETDFPFKPAPIAIIPNPNITSAEGSGTAFGRKI